MRILIISANKEQINMRTWPLGAALIATAAKSAGHIVDLIDIMDYDDVAAEIAAKFKSFQPNLVGISIRNIDNQSMIDTSDYLADLRDLVLSIRRNFSGPVVLGGAGFGIFPLPLLRYLEANIGVRGDGENAFSALIESYLKGNDFSGLPGVCTLDNGCNPPARHTKLDDFEMPDIEFLPDSKLAVDHNFWLPVQTRRGCPLKCSYCSTPAIEGCRLRLRTHETVISWIRKCVDIGFRRFFFVDNTFNIPLKYASSLCESIIQAGLNIEWRCILYPLHMTQHLAKMMADSGCAEVSLGFESGSDRMLGGMNKRFKTEDVAQSARILREHGIRRMGFLLLGGPGETESSVQQSLEFADSLNLDMVKVTQGIRIYPETSLAVQAIKDGIIDASDDLLHPRFYMIPELTLKIDRIIDEWTTERPNWFK